MKALLQGKPCARPLHPALVHFPLGLFALSLVLDVAALRWHPGDGFEGAAYYALGLGLVTALVAALAGLVDRHDIRRDHPARRVATAHMTLNIVALLAYGAGFALRSVDGPGAPVGLAAFALSCAGMAVLAVSGYLGGTLVYRHGIGVGRHRRSGRTPRATVMLDAARARGGFVLVGRTRGIADGEMLRVQVKGLAIVIVRVNRDFYAFQDYCTHRYGPLSEGCIADGQVQCPWHRSRFDLRTGKVTRGPAKVDLRTYAVEEREGMLFLKVE